MIFAPSTFSSLPPKLQTGVKWTRQGVLTVAEGQVVADLTLVSVELTVSMSATCLAPSTPNLL